MQPGQVPWSDALQFGSTAKTAAVAAVVPPRSLPRPRTTTWAKSALGLAPGSSGEVPADADAQAPAGMDATHLATSKVAPSKPPDLRRPAEPAHPPRRRAKFPPTTAAKSTDVSGAFAPHAMAAGAVPPGYEQMSLAAQMQAMTTMFQQIHQPKPAAPAPSSNVTSTFIEAAEQFLSRAPVAPKAAPSQQQRGATVPQRHAPVSQQQPQPQAQQQRQLHPQIHGAQPQVAKDSRNRQSRAPGGSQRQSKQGPEASAPKTGQDAQVQGQGALQKAQWKRTRDGPTFAVGSVVQYWSSTKGKWVTTRVKAQHLDENGKVTAYDCSGKPYALATKVRAAPHKLQQKAATGQAPRAAAAAATPQEAGTGAPAAGTAAEPVKAFERKVVPPRVALPAGMAAKMKQKQKAKQPVFNVGDRVWYWSSHQRTWLNTRIKKVNRRKDGVIVSYDCSGKPKADPRKLRPRPSKSAKAKVAANAAATEANAAPPPAATGQSDAGAAAPEAKALAKPAATEKRFHTGQKVYYLSGQLQKYVVTEVLRVLRSESGKRFYDLSVKKKVPESRIRPIKTKAPAQKAEQPPKSDEPLLFKNDLKRQAPSTSSPSKRQRTGEAMEAPPPPPEPEAAGAAAEAPPGPPGPPSPEKGAA